MLAKRQLRGTMSVHEAQRFQHAILIAEDPKLGETIRTRFANSLGLGANVVPISLQSPGRDKDPGWELLYSRFMAITVSR